MSGLWTSHLLALSPTWHPGLDLLVLFGSLGAASLILLVRSEQGRALPAAALAAALVVLLIAPALGSIETAAEAHSGSLPTAVPTDTVDRGRGGPGGAGGGPGGFPSFGGQRGGIGGLLDAAEADPALVTALQQDAGRYTWTAATTGANNAAGLALSSGTSVMAIGGFNGSDPTPTLAEFQADVAAGRIHWYVDTGDARGFRGTQGGSQAARQIAEWVASTFAAQPIGGATVYDLTAG